MKVDKKKGKNMLFLFLDTETTGLNYKEDNSTPRTNKMLQLAYKLYDEKVEKEISSNNYYVKYSKEELKEIKKSMNSFVKEMHEATGLLDVLETEKTKNISTIDEELSNLLENYSEHKIIIAGNNIQFDYEVVRRNLPKTSSKLNYSILDVSSVRKVFSTVGSDFGKKTKDEKLSNHDALVDIDECIKELKKYQNILRKGLEKNS